MARRIKALLIWLHLYLGIALCLLFLVWFVSGIAMVYYRTPVLTDAQRIATVPAISRVPSQAPAAIAPLAAAWPSAEGIHLGQLHDRPIWRWRTNTNGWSAAWADDASGAHFDGPALLEDARRWLNSSDAQFIGEYTADDQWTYFTALRPHYPVLRYSTGGTLHRDVYFSSRTGEPVSATTPVSRALYYLGPGLHYFSFYPIRNRDQLWRNLVNWSSGIGTLVCLFGLIVGIWRIRWDAIGTARQVLPFKKFWMYWHHWVGLAFGVFATTFVLSGLFSMNPAKIFPETTIPKALQQAWLGGRPQISALPALPSELAHSHEISFAQLAGNAQLIGLIPGSPRRLFVSTPTGWEAHPPYSENEIRASIQPLLSRPLASIEQLEGFDTYYYARKDNEKPLPALRLRLGDERDTWYYADPATGALFLKSDYGTRARRWLYNGLHSFDLQSLLNRPWLWTVVIWGLSLIGIALSVTSTMVSWHWLKRWAARRRKRRLAERLPSPA
ncbi:MAG: PepSY domain-containing protein [Steroidobacteraceae bacterium]